MCDQSIIVNILIYIYIFVKRGATTKICVWIVEELRILEEAAM